MLLRSPNDTIQTRSDSMCKIFYRWIELKCYQKILEVCFYVGVKFQVNPCSGRTCDID
jgi:hypothetical protein